MKKIILNTALTHRILSLTLALTLAAGAIPAAHAAEPQAPASVTAAADSWVKLANGTYTFASKANEKYYIDAAGATTSKGANLQLYKYTKANLTQQFKLSYNKDKGWATLSPASKTSLKVNAYSDHPKAGCNANVWSATGDATQGWVFRQVGDYYAICSAYNKDLCLTVESVKNSANVKLSKFTGSDMQLFKVTALKTPGASAFPLGADEAKAIVKKVGTQKNTASYASRCAAVDVAYVYYWLKGKTTGVEASANWSKVGGISMTASTKDDLAKKIKTQLANGGVAILHTTSTNGISGGGTNQHWVLVRGYKVVDGKDVFYIVDPWDGTLTTMTNWAVKGKGYKVHNDLRVVLCQGK